MFRFNRNKIIGSTSSDQDSTTLAASPSVNHTGQFLWNDYSTGVLEGMMADTSEKVLNTMYREIYMYDTVSGPAVDLISNMPWSEFDMLGVKDDKILRKFRESAEELNVPSLMIQLSVSYLVLGVVIGSLIFSENRGIFTDLIVHNPDEVELEKIPLIGYDPKINLKVTPSLKKFMRSRDPRDREAQKEISSKLQSQILNKDKIPLEPLSTIYLARSYVPGVTHMSYYTRILPIWLIEKALMRGTIIGAWRRQRSILHIVAGDDEWEPTDQQLQALSSLFTNADLDPQGAVVTTRQGIDAQEVRRGGDFWKLTDEWDMFANAKMRAMGINEQFLCLSEDTLVPTSKGIKYINEIEDTTGLKKDENLEINVKVKGKDNKIVTANKLWYRGISNVYSNVTKSGYSVDTTNDHTFLVLGDKLKPKKVRSKDLNESHFLCIDTSGKDLTTKTKNIELSDIKLPKMTTYNQKPRKPEKITTSLAYLLGLVVSEWDVNKYKVRLSNTDKELLDRYEKCVYKVFGNLHIGKYGGKESEKNNNHSINGHKINSKKKCFSYEINSKILSYWLKQLGIDEYVPKDIKGKSKSKYKTVPKSILESNRKIKLAFLSGFIDGDGSVYERGNVTFHSSSKEMLKQIRVILADLGYPSYFTTIKKELRLKESVGSKLLNEINRYVSHSEKRNDTEINPTPRTFGIPIKPLISFLENRHVKREVNVGEWFTNDKGEKVLINSWGIRTTKFIGKLHDSNSPRKVLPYSSYEEGKYEDLLEIIKQISEKMYNRMISLFNKKYLFDEFSHREEAGEKRLYDLTIEEGEAPYFIANGILVHNSGDASYRNMETALSVFIENIRVFRDFLTNNILYNKIFLMMAKYHGFKHRTKAELDHGIRISDEKVHASKNLAQAHNYIIPEIQWKKQLRASGDDQLVDLLGRAEEKGIPIPLRQYATAAGVDMQNVLDSYDDDIEIRRKVKEYKDKLEKEGLKGGEEEGGGGGGGFFGSVKNPNKKVTVEEVLNNIPKETKLSAKDAGKIMDIARGAGAGEKPQDKKTVIKGENKK